MGMMARISDKHVPACNIAAVEHLLGLFKGFMMVEDKHGES